MDGTGRDGEPKQVWLDQPDDGSFPGPAWCWCQLEQVLERMLGLRVAGCGLRAVGCTALRSTRPAMAWLGLDQHLWPWSWG